MNRIAWLLALALTMASTHLAAKSGGQSGVVASQIATKMQDRQYGKAISENGRYLAFTNRGSMVGIHDLSTGEVKTVVTKPYLRLGCGAL